MEFCASVYSVLLVSASEKFTSSVKKLLPKSRYDPIDLAESVTDARRMALEHSYDFVLINTPLPDEFGTRLALDLSRDGETGIMLFVRAEHYADISGKVTEYGVLVIPKPSPPQTVTQSLLLLAATRERLRRMARKAESLEEKMEEIRLVNRAKWLLIEQLKMTEPDAHRYIEKTAMDRCVTKRTVAETIIKTYQ